MAKKGGVSEINGFVSVKNEDPKAISKKVVSHVTSESGQKASSVIKKTSGKPSDAQELKKSVAVHSKSKASGKVVRNSVESNNSKQQNSKKQIIKDVSVQRTPKTSDLAKTTSEPIRSVHKSKAAERSSRTTSQTKTSEKADKQESSIDTSKQRKVTSLKKDASNNKVERDSRTRAVDPTKLRAEVTLRKETTDKKSQQKNILVNSSSNKSSTANREKKTTDVKPKKTVDTKLLKNDSKRRADVKTSVSSPKATTKVRVVSSSTNSKKVSSNESENVTKIIINSKETSKITIKESESAKIKDILEDEIKIKTSSKDSVYFEVDLGAKKEPPRIEPSTPLPPPISRQGTFTKNDDESRESSLTLPVISHDIAPDEEEYDYEDDFEDYESDFEEYLSESGVSSDSNSESSNKDQNKREPDKREESSLSGVKPYERTVEEEKKLDSGNYDLSAKSITFVLPQSVKQKQLDQIKEAISRENSLYSERGTNSTELVENGGEDILDFVDALKKQGEEKIKKEKKSRSLLILEKIELHVQKISIFDGDFLSIEDLDPLYHNRNVAHVGTEAAIISRNEDIQTDDIKTKEKWIQFPPAFHKRDETKNLLELYFEDKRGFGGDNVEFDLNKLLNPYYNPEKLYNFINSASQVILIMLEEEARWKSDGSISVMKSKHDHGFSRGYIPVQTKNLQFLKNRPICDIVFSPHNQNIFISSHRFVKDIENFSFEEQLTGRSILCLWNMLEPSQPLSILVASCQISAIAFDIAHSNILYGGLTDGSVCLWDTNEQSIFHKETVAGMTDPLLRTPSYCSSYMMNEDLHHNVIVSVQSLGYEGKGSLGNFIPSEVLTLDCDGKIILWITVSTLRNIEADYSFDKEDFGQPFWSKFKLVASRTINPLINLPSTQNLWSLQFLCMTSAPQGKRSALVGTNTGVVLHCIFSEEKADIPVFNNKEETDCMISVLSLEKCPHQFPVFLAGCSNGTIRIHVMERRRPVRILLMENQLRGSPISKIRWSQLGAGLFFVLDKNLSLHLWDLCKGTSSPLISLPMKKLKATHFDISSDNKFLYLGLVVHKERLEIHRLKEQFTPELGTENEDKEIFSSFIEKCFY